MLPLCGKLNSKRARPLFDPAAAKRVEEQIAEEQRVEAEMAEEQRQLDAELLAEKQALEERHRVRVAQQKQKQDARRQEAQRQRRCGAGVLLATSR
jgi:hypothetical protein